MFGMELPEDLPAGNLSLTAEGNINFGSHVFQVIPTPGHSQGSVSFYCAKENVVLLVIHSSREVLVGQTSLAEIDFRL